MEGTEAGAIEWLTILDADEPERLEAALVDLRDWLAEQIHRHDQVYTADKLVKRVTGKPLSVEAFAKHIRAKVTTLYGAPGNGRSRTRR